MRSISQSMVAAAIVLSLATPVSAQYFVGVSWDGIVYHIDPSDGTGNFVGDSSWNSVNSMGKTTTGELIAIQLDDRFLSIDPITGLAGVIGPMPEPVSNVNSLAFDSMNRVYFRDTGDSLWRISAVGMTDLTLISDQTNSLLALDFAPDDTLYGWDIDFGLVTIDLVTGAVTNVNGLVDGHGDIQTLAFDGAGNLFGARDQLFLIDVVSGIPSLIGSGGYDDIRGMAFVEGLCDFIPGQSNDCNGNMIPDECDIIQGAAVDCNRNFIPDDCDFAAGLFSDCNTNGVPDTCEIDDGVESDCNLNGVPDTCDLSDEWSTDFDGNGIPDECDPDCDQNGLGDPLDVFLGLAPDCNGNFIPDDCDVTSAFSLDCNTNGVPDECDDDHLLIPLDGMGHTTMGNDGFGFDVDISGHRLIAGSRRHVHGAVGEGAAYIYAYDATAKTWIENAELRNSDPTEFTFFGVCTALDGDVAAVGGASSDLFDATTIATYVFRRDPVTDLWSEEAILPVESSDPFNIMIWRWVAIRDDLLIAGNPVNNPPSAFVYRHDGAQWQLEQVLENPALNFGISVDIDGDVAVVGSHRDSSVGNESGSAFVFRFNGTAWVQEAKLVASDGNADDNFGVSVAVQGDTVLIGSYRDDDLGVNSGAAYVYHFDGMEWMETQKLLAPSGSAHDNFGASVDLDATTAVIGAGGNDDGADDGGAVHVFTFDGLSWVPTAKFFDPQAAVDDFLGSAVAVDGPLVVAGAPGPSANPDPGKAFVFRSDLDPDCDGNGTLDACDIADGIVADVNFNGIPDTCEPILLGDANLDGIVGITDFLAVLAQWGACVGCTADFDGDNMVGITDFLTVLANWSQEA